MTHHARAPLTLVGLVGLVAVPALAGCGGSSGDASGGGGGDASAYGSPDAAGDAAPFDGGDGADGGDAAPELVTLADGDLRIDVHLATGRWDVSRGAKLVVEGAVADALVDDGAGPRTVTTAGCALTRDPGDGAFVCAGPGVELRLSLGAPAGKGHVTAQLGVTNAGTGTLTVLRVSPLVVAPETGGALWLGAKPKRHRILENGRFIAFDSTVQLEQGDVPRWSLGFTSPLPLRGNSVSNWNHLVADLDDLSRSLVAGYLTFEHAVPLIGIASDAAATPGPDGRVPFTTYAAESALVFHGKPLAAGATIASELFYLDPLPADPIAALETYARAVAAHLGIVPWHRRGGGKHVPCGWNSWGRYGHAIDAAVVADNADVMARDFAPFGGGEMQIDDGWQEAYGDWTWRADRFPGGGATVATSLAARGLTPGLWIGPFGVDQGSALAAAHPDWIAPKEQALIGQLAGSGDNLDLSNADARQFVHDTLAARKAEGFRWIKADFTYWALLGKPTADPTMTNVEAFRAGWRTMRDALGPDVFLLGIGFVGPNIGVLDGMRLTLDNGATWDEASADDVLGSPRAFKATVRTGSRRWFYQDRIWVSHDDDLYFGDALDPGGAALTLDESRAFATWVAFSGGSVEMGDKLVDMAAHPEWTDVVRRLLPPWPAGSRPLDVLVRDYPEEFRLHVKADAGEWDMVGLFHWGTNRDRSVEPGKKMADAPRTHALACPGTCLAWELWSETFLGSFTGTKTVTVAPHTAQAISLRPALAVPQLLGTNRHVMQGANDLGAIAWDAGTKTLSGSLVPAVGSATAPFEHRLAFHAPAGFTLDHATVDGVDGLSAAQAGEVVTVKLRARAGEARAAIPFQVVFR